MILVVSQTEDSPLKSHMMEMLDSSNQARQELQIIIKESAFQASQQLGIVNDRMESAVKQRDQLKKELAKATDQIHALQMALNMENRKRMEAELQVQELNSIVQELSVYEKEEKTDYFSLFQEKLSEFQALFQQNKVENKKLLQSNKTLKNQVVSLKQQKNFIQNQHSILTQEKIELTVKLKKTQKEILELQDEIKRIKQEKNKTQNSLSQQLAKCKKQYNQIGNILLQSDHQRALTTSSISQLQQKLLTAQSKILKLQVQLSKTIQSHQHQISKLKKDLSLKNQVSKQRTKALKSQLGKSEAQSVSLQQKVSQISQKLAQKNSQADRLFRQKQEAYCQINSLEQFACLNQDLSHQITEFKQLLKQQEKHSAEIIADLQKNTEKLQKQLVVKQQEIKCLLNKIPSNFYQPVKDDLVDNALADYLNRRPQALSVPFVREDPGLYLYGTKRVFIKLQQGNIVIRVGGGFMLIDEFIQVYSPTEFEKIENRVKANQNRQKTKGYRDSYSPVSRNLTPTKAAQMIKSQLGKGQFTMMYALTKRPPSPGQSPFKRAHSMKKLSDKQGQQIQSPKNR